MKLNRFGEFMQRGDILHLKGNGKGGNEEGQDSSAKA